MNNYECLMLRPWERGHLARKMKEPSLSGVEALLIVAFLNHENTKNSNSTKFSNRGFRGFFWISRNNLSRSAIPYVECFSFLFSWFSFSFRGFVIQTTRGRDSFNYP